MTTDDNGVSFDVNDWVARQAAAEAEAAKAAGFTDVDTYREHCDAERAAEEAEQRREAAERRARAIRHDIIPSRYREARLADMTDGHLAAVRAWVDVFNDGIAPEPPGLFIVGPIGAGKTHLTYAIVDAVIDCLDAASRQPTIYRTTKLLRDLRPDSGFEHAEVIETCQNTTLLVLSDLGTEKPSEFTQEVMFEILDHRYEWKRPTIVTSNWPLQQLGEYVGERVTSRLREMCATVPVVGADRRKPPARTR